MKIKLTFNGSIMPEVDKTSGKMAVVNDLTTPFSIQFINGDEMVRLIKIIAAAYEKQHTIITFNKEGIDIAEFTKDFNKEDVLNPRHDEDESPKVPMLMPTIPTKG